MASDPTIEGSSDVWSPEFKDALDDVHTRFLLNLPESESTADRILFQVEQAWWFYEDFLCDPQPLLNLPRFSAFKSFASILFEYSPLLDSSQFNRMWREFSEYKRKISGYGCILLSSDRTKIILCQVWGGSSSPYMLPGGKLNQGENGAQAAARETYEETGFDPLCKSGLTAEWKETDPSKITWTTTLTEEDLLVHAADNGKRRNCYVVTGVPDDFPFEPVARKEVQHIDWYPLDQIPKPNFAVLPFMGKLKNWIKKQKQAERARSNAKPRKRTPKKTGQSRSRGANNSTPKRPQVEPTGILTKGAAAVTPPIVSVATPQKTVPTPRASPQPKSSNLVLSFEENSQFIQNWVDNLPAPKLTKYFGTFRLNAEDLWANAEKNFTK